jgi:hypothetical protein
MFEERRRVELAKFYREVVVQVLDGRHSDRHHWDSAVQRVRDGLRASDERDLTDVIGLRDLQRPINEIFRRLYTLTQPSSEPPALHGSCPVTRARGSDHYAQLDPPLLTLDSVQDDCDPRLEEFAQRLADESRRCWIALEPPTNDRRRHRRIEEMRTAVWRLAAMGIVEFALPEHMLSTSDWQQVSMYSPHRFVVRSDLSGESASVRPMPLRRVSYIDRATERFVGAIMGIARPMHIIIVDPSIADPLMPNRTVLSTRRHSRWDDFLNEIDG